LSNRMLRIVGLRRLDCPIVTMVTRSSSGVRLNFYNQFVYSNDQILRADIRKRYLELCGIDSEVVSHNAEPNEYYDSTCLDVYRELHSRDLVNVDQSVCYYNPRTNLIVADTTVKSFSLPMRVGRNNHIGNVLVWYESINEWVSHRDLFELLGEYEIERQDIKTNKSIVNSLTLKTDETRQIVNPLGRTVTVRTTRKSLRHPYQASGCTFRCFDPMGGYVGSNASLMAQFAGAQYAEVVNALSEQVRHDVVKLDSYQQRVCLHSRDYVLPVVMDSVKLANHPKFIVSGGDRLKVPGQANQYFNDVFIQACRPFHQSLKANNEVDAAIGVSVSEQTILIGRELSLIDANAPVKISNQVAPVTTTTVEPGNDHWALMDPIESNKGSFDLELFTGVIVKQTDRVATYANHIPADYAGPTTPMTSFEKWAMVEMLSVVDHVHQMATVGDFRQLANLLVNFSDSVLLRREWGYAAVANSIHRRMAIKPDEADISALYRYITIFDQFIALLQIILPDCLPNTDDCALSIARPETAKRVLSKLLLDQHRQWHHEYRSLVNKINQIRRLLSIDGPLQIALFANNDEFSALGGFAREIGLRTNATVTYTSLPAYTCDTDVYHPSFGFLVEEFTTMDIIDKKLNIAIDITHLDIGQLITKCNHHLMDELHEKHEQRVIRSDQIKKILRKKEREAENHQDDKQIERDIEQLQRKDFLRTRDMSDSVRQANQLARFMGQMKTYQRAQGIKETPSFVKTLNTSTERQSAERDDSEETTHEWNF